MDKPGTGEHIRRQVISNFQALALDYDGLTFVQVCAARLVEMVAAAHALPMGARVLDVATGTGFVALLSAQIVGPTGHVLGIDLSPDMLLRARQKLATLDLPQVQFRQGDAEHLDVLDQSFDVALCASSLFFVPDMLGALREWYRVLRPGGRVAFSSFGPSFMKPVNDLWAARLQQHGLVAATTPNPRLEDARVCAQLLHDAGFEQVAVHSEQLGYYQSAEQRWHEIMSSLDGVPIRQLPDGQREKIRVAHMAELQSITTEKGIWIDVPAHIAMGIKPSHMQTLSQAA
jgi:ubiquinone/menaquinone biosynthesis C-methylase UbiE